MTDVCKIITQWLAISAGLEISSSSERKVEGDLLVRFLLFITSFKIFHVFFIFDLALSNLF